MPLKYAIDENNCIFLTKGKCRVCEKVCPSGAINFEDKEKKTVLHVGSIVLSTGFDTYDPAQYDTFGYTKSPNILTSIEFERMLSSSGPFGGHLIRPSDNKEPEKIAWLQCIGSRDEHNGAKPYCSSVCCTYAVKEAIVAKEHRKGKLDTAIFYIDIRTFGKDFESYYNRAKDEKGVRFIKSKIARVIREEDSDHLLIGYTDEEGKRVEEKFDMVVLSVGLSISKESIELAKKAKIDLDQLGFAQTTSFRPVETSRPGIFISGAFHSPKDIPSSVTDASAAAAKASAMLSDARFSLTKIKQLPAEIPSTEIMGQRPRIGVFVCRCGTNIAGVVDVPSVAEYARKLPYVAHVDENLFSCSQDTQEQITAAIQEHQLNRVVVASCTPQTHEPLFQETVRNAGINKYLFEMANIRNQCSWVHAEEPEKATDKARDLVRMAISKVSLLEPLSETELDINQAALVIGGGIAGMSAAKNLAQQGYKTFLIEKTGALGGNALSLYKTWKGEYIQEELKELVDDITSDTMIETFLNADIVKVEGFVGNFTTTIISGGKEIELTHGVTIIATGATELKPDEYLYGTDPRVITSLELDRMFIKKDKALKEADTCVFIQCVGSRIPERPYCSKVCCTHSVVSALELKELNPQMRIFVLYRDMRTYGLREEIYKKAREKGVVFVRYESEQELRVDKIDGRLGISFTDYTLKRRITIGSNLLVLASAIKRDKNDPLSQLFKIPANSDGFFVEAHVKLRPVDFATDGVFFCGLAHSPKPIDESIAQAQAAASRAVTLLAQKTIYSSGTVAVVNPLYCSSCGVCEAVCPYRAAELDKETGIAKVNPALCKGCGLCVASCRSGAIHLNGFDEGQIMAMIGAING